MSEPKVIQGGMGVAVSSWKLANEVARLGGLGVISGTGIEAVLVRRLQHGDPGGHYRRALNHFPFPEVANRLIETFFVEGGIGPNQRFARMPVASANMTKEHQQAIVAGAFAEVWLAKEGHQGLVGVNLLEKVQITNLPALYGVMLADVDYVLMGAGIPREIPGVLDRFAQNLEASLKLYVIGATSEDDFRLKFNPKEIFGENLPQLKRPKFLAIIASAVLALTLAKKASGRVDGFIIEGPTAGGHNAPPRGQPEFNERGEPIYGPKDEVDLEAIKKLGLPFWLAGSYGHPEKLREALAAGAVGIQVGSAFALTVESGITTELKEQILKAAANNELDVYTDPLASPTGFPFKLALLKGTLSEPELYEARPRLCDIGYLKQAYKKEDGTLGLRCPAEPVEDYVKKGGNIEDTKGRKCLCNALMANIGVGNLQPKGYREQPLITLGDDGKTAYRLVKSGKTIFTAADVMRDLLGNEKLNSTSDRDINP